LDRSCRNIRLAGEVLISMRPVSVFANGPSGAIEELRDDPQGWWRQAVRAVMMLLSVQGLPPAQIAALLECHPAMVRRWISRFNDEGLAGPAPVRAAPPGRGPAYQPDHRAAAAPRAVDPAADPRPPGLSAGQRAHLVPVCPAGGDLVAAEADRPRRPGP
jgi:hypothetical protein